MELKPGIRVYASDLLWPFNRTSMELKLHGRRSQKKTALAFNRTSMELKRRPEASVNLGELIFCQGGCLPRWETRLSGRLAGSRLSAGAAVGLELGAFPSEESRSRD